MATPLAPLAKRRSDFAAWLGLTPAALQGRGAACLSAAAALLQ